VKTELKRKMMANSKAPEKGIKIVVGGPEFHRSKQEEVENLNNNPEQETNDKQGTVDVEMNENCC